METNQSQSIEQQATSLPSGYLEAPLVSLVNKEMSEMTQEELREHVMKLQDARASQTFYATARTAVKVDKETSKLNDSLSEFD